MPNFRSIMATHVVLVALVIPSPGAAHPDPREDTHGDPLPSGAIGRLGSTRLRHSGYIKGLTFLPDGKTLAAVDLDGVVRLWDVATGKERLHYDSGAYGQPNIAAWHTRSPVVFSPNHRLAASNHGTGFNLFEAATGNRLYRQDTPPKLGHRDYSNPICFSGDDRILANGDQGTWADLYSVASGAKLLLCSRRKSPCESNRGSDSDVENHQFRPIDAKPSTSSCPTATTAEA
jgi:WD40 repeat protein